MTTTALADHQGVSKHTVYRALDDDEPALAGYPLEVREATEEDYEELDITRRTKRLVRLVTPGPSVDGDTDEDVERELGEEIESRAHHARDDLGSTRETIKWLEGIKNGSVKYEKAMAGAGKPRLMTFPPEAQFRAAKEAEQLRQWLDERERNFIPRGEVANALVSTATLLRDRMQAVPSRLADTLSSDMTVGQIRSELSDSIDAILHELGDEVERHLEDLMEAEG